MDDLVLWMRDSMDRIRLSGEGKKRLTDTLTQQAVCTDSSTRQTVYTADSSTEQADCPGRDGNNMDKRRLHKTAVLVLAAVFIIGAVSAGAVYFVSRSRTLEAELRMTGEQRQRAEKSGLLYSPDAQNAAGEVTSVTDNGITVTVEQTIVDSYFAMLAFRIDGYAVPEGQSPDIGNLRIEVDGGDPVSWSGGFYDGIVSEKGMAAYYDDGSPLEYSENGNLIQRYAAEDGSLRYHVMLSGFAGSLIGKEIEVCFDGIGTGDKAEYFPDKDGHWDLRWTLTGSDEVRIVHPEQQIGNSGAILAEADISPISLRAVVRIPAAMEIARLLADDDDEVIPRLLGVRTKDGTVDPYLCMGMGYSAPLSDDSEKARPGSLGEHLYVMQFCTHGILNPEDVDALVFLKSYPEDGKTLAEENLYIVPLDSVG